MMMEKERSLEKPYSYSATLTAGSWSEEKEKPIG
jgi:hypothetical protein